jgi:hypothetical protein
MRDGNYNSLKVGDWVFYYPTNVKAVVVGEAFDEGHDFIVLDVNGKTVNATSHEIQLMDDNA